MVYYDVLCVAVVWRLDYGNQFIKRYCNPRNGNKYNQFKTFGPRVAVGLGPNVYVMKPKAYCEILHTDPILMHPTIAAYSHPKHPC